VRHAVCVHSRRKWGCMGCEWTARFEVQRCVLVRHAACVHSSTPTTVGGHSTGRRGSAAAHRRHNERASRASRTRVERRASNVTRAWNARAWNVLRRTVNFGLIRLISPAVLYRPSYERVWAPRSATVVPGQCGPHTPRRGATTSGIRDDDTFRTRHLHSARSPCSGQTPLPPRDAVLVRSRRP
jgi:hypothetical protein